MKDRIFDYSSYKKYLTDLISSAPSNGRGMKTRWADAAQVQTTYVSQVLGGSRHFSLEQAELLNLHLEHSDEEARFFILLVLRERAGNPALRARLSADIFEQVEKYRNLKDRLSAKKEVLTPEIQAAYYRAWYITAVHVCLTVSALRTKEAIARALGLPLKIVGETLEFLLKHGLAEKHGAEYHTGSNVVFVGRDSPALLPHHLNWRHQAIRSIELARKEDIHYSSVVSVRKKDVERIRALVLQAIEDARLVWKDAKHEEEMHSLCIDFFRVGSDG